MMLKLTRTIREICEFFYGEGSRYRRGLNVSSNIVNNLDSSSIHGPEEENEYRKEVIALEASESNSLPASKESQQDDNDTNAIENPNLSDELHASN